MSAKMEQRLELRPAQTFEIGLEISYLPDFALIRHLEENAFPLKTRTKKEIVGTIKTWANSFKRDYFSLNLENPEALEKIRRTFSSIYCALNFLVPEWQLNEELAQTKESFLKDMEKLKIRGALTLYHQSPNQALPAFYDLTRHYKNRDTLADQVLNSEEYIQERFSTLASENLNSPRQLKDERLDQRIIETATEFHFRRTPPKPPYSLATQLDYLVRVIINPKMTGVVLTNPTQKQAEEKYLQIAEANGPFIMPLPRLKR